MRTEGAAQGIMNSVPLRTKLTAATVLLVFMLMAVCNALVTQKSLVKLTNTEIANTHPVYLLPSGYAFSIWGIIYLLQGLFCVVQCLPFSWGGLTDPAFAKIRPIVLLLFASNATWLFLFGYEAYWLSVVIILVYDACLFAVLLSLDVDMLSTQPRVIVKFAAAAFSANASWVTVASCLGIQVALLEEGWPPSPGFAVGLLGIAVLVACTSIIRWSDPVYAAVAAWALGGIINNQGPDSEWGCNTQICPACISGGGELSICERINTVSSLHGWADASNGYAALECNRYNESVARVCIVDKSKLVSGWALAGIVIVAVTLVVSLSRGCARRVIAARTEHLDGRDVEGDAKKLTCGSEKENEL
mmetsp:Transcript_25532/g.42190  ORF Transcript_25532/g.42190 Transcript_25532/m.42190 type:complete len:361 (+) Transcript_25532:52-1134(+)